MELEQGGAVKFSGTKADDWYIDYARQAMENGTMPTRENTGALTMKCFLKMSVCYPFSPL